MLAVIATIGLVSSFHVGAQALSQLADTKPSVALSKANEILEQNPNDEEGLFFRARALKNLGKANQAKEIYQLLIERWPANPEPYVNLAAIYSSEGDIQKAQNTLIEGINAHDGYSKLYAGLKEINGQLAAQAYLKALNKEVKDKPINLELAKNMVVSKSVIQEKEVVKEVVKEVPVEVIKEVIKEVPVEVIKEVIKEVPVEVIKEVEVIKIKEVIKEVPVPTKTEVAQVQTNEQASETDVELTLQETIKGWARAWSTKNVPAFTQFYTSDYTPENSSISHRAWLRDRELKISNKKFISVRVDNFSQRSREGGDVIDVIFTQAYRSNTVSDTIKKRLSFVQEAGEWKISAERVIGR